MISTDELHDSQLYNVAGEYDQVILQFAEDELTDQQLVHFLENFEQDLTTSREERKFIFFKLYFL